MITLVDLNEAIGFATQVLQKLQRILTGTSAPTANFLCSELIVNGAVELHAGGNQFWIDFANCFEATQQAGVAFADMQTVLNLANGFAPVGRAAIAVKNFAIRMSIVEQARILAATTFTSRQQIDDLFSQIDASLQAAELTAADNLDNVAYLLLLNIHAAVSNDLSTRSFTLPQMVQVNYSSRMPSLWIAQNVYGDASRNDEIIAENAGVIHPLFMPTTVNCLAQ